MSEIKNTTSEVAIPEINDSKSAEPYIKLIVNRYPDKIPKRAFLPIVPGLWCHNLMYYIMNGNISPRVIIGLVDYFPEAFNGPLEEKYIKYLIKHDQLKKLDKIIIYQYEINDELISLILDIKKHNPQINIYGTLDFCIGLQYPKCNAHTLKLRQLCTENNIKFKLCPRFYAYILFRYDYDRILQFMEGIFEQVDWLQAWKDCLEHLTSIRYNMHLSLYSILTRPEFIENISQPYQNKFNLQLIPPENFNLLSEQDRYKILRVLLYSDPKWINQHNLFESNRHLIDLKCIILYNFDTKLWFEKYPELFDHCHVEIDIEDFIKFNRCDIMYCTERLKKFSYSPYEEELLVEIYQSLPFDDQLKFIVKFMQDSRQLREIYKDKNLDAYFKYKDFLNYCDEMEQS